MSECIHTLEERWNDCSDGGCPFCLAAELERLRAQNAELRTENDHFLAAARIDNKELVKIRTESAELREALDHIYENPAKALVVIGALRSKQ